MTRGASTCRQNPARSIATTMPSIRCGTCSISLRRSRGFSSAAELPVANHGSGPLADPLFAGGSRFNAHSFSARACAEFMPRQTCGGLERRRVPAHRPTLRPLSRRHTVSPGSNGAQCAARHRPIRTTACRVAGRSTQDGVRPARVPLSALLQKATLLWAGRSRHLSGFLVPCRDSRRR